MSISKLAQAYLRGGDFSHPGEIEAIHYTMNPIIKNPKQLLLDVGCGLGGTASYIQQNGWGKVTGIDIDQEVLDYARKHYPESSFFKCDASQSHNFFQDKKFQIIYLFCSFFCFSKQEESLSSLSHVAARDCNLIIFDYRQFVDYPLDDPFVWSKNSPHFYPIDSSIETKLKTSGWCMKKQVDISDKLKKWYEHFITEFDKKREGYIKQFGEELFNKMHYGYSCLLDNICQRKIGGSIIYAKLIN
ncbi:hypothetical protein Lgra_1263 [Legionella gratiana]|uniref:Ubiquinone/menaquinone biosynthesis methyltransferase n=1 Tax=Legionella gratiana TaxID=45066 RepID=A0A378J168_9GAMM|nr:class I SAM-dependent methyltransferase [Legionella gratiana]KTD11805.1 hypothetical protein Lgra_1263 [Legionella gratiana]STX40711.1 ubiquinone/menaquinone biosynthesis methyltransferase [Legionella gratiana]